MEDDFYIFEPARNHLIGRRTRRIIRLGDKVEVQVAKVNIFKKQVDFRLATRVPAGSDSPRGRQSPRETAGRPPSAARDGSRQSQRFTGHRRTTQASHRPRSGSGRQQRRRH